MFNIAKSVPLLHFIQIFKIKLILKQHTLQICMCIMYSII